MSNNEKIARVAISGRSGCGNTTIGAMVASALNAKQINYTFRNLAVDKGLSFGELRRMAESDDAFDRELDAKQIAMAMEGSCVLGSRLAIWLLEEANLKVYMDISSQERAARIHRREGGSFDEKLRETEERDRLDHARYLRVYGIDTDLYRERAHLVIADDTMSPGEITKVILTALEKRRA